MHIRDPRWSLRGLHSNQYVKLLRVKAEGVGRSTTNGLLCVTESALCSSIGHVAWRILLSLVLSLSVSLIRSEIHTLAYSIVERKPEARGQRGGVRDCERDWWWHRDDGIVGPMVQLLRYAICDDAVRWVASLNSRRMRCVRESLRLAIDQIWYMSIFNK